MDGLEFDINQEQNLLTVRWEATETLTADWIAEFYISDLSTLDPSYNWDVEDETPIAQNDSGNWFIKNMTFSGAGLTNVFDNAAGLPGTSTVLVTAEDGVTTRTYLISLTLAKDEILSMEGPLRVIPGDTITVSMGYKVSVQRDLTVRIQVNAPYKFYGGTIVKLEKGSDIIDVKFQIDPEIPIASGKYIILSILAPEGGNWANRFDDLSINNVDAFWPSTDATLADLQVGNILVPDFDPEIQEYTVELPYGTVNVPELRPVLSHENASYVVTNAADLSTNSTVMVLAEDGETTKTYIVNFTETAPSNAESLSDLNVDGITITGFQPDVEAYIIEVEDINSIPEVTLTKTHPGAVDSGIKSNK